MTVRSCRQCGVKKPENLFRKYYNGRKGRYTICLTCEKINSRRKYLNRKQDKSEEDIAELEKIELLYETLRKAGLKPPSTDTHKDDLDLDGLIARYSAAAAPLDLAKWLTTDLVEDPDYYLDDVYEQLKKTYRPVVRIGDDGLPVYDDRFKDTLNEILNRFYEYEDVHNER